MYFGHVTRLPNSSNMVTKTTSDLLQELGRMNFFGKGEVMALIDAETAPTRCAVG